MCHPESSSEHYLDVNLLKIIRKKNWKLNVQVWGHMCACVSSDRAADASKKLEGRPEVGGACQKGVEPYSKGVGP